MTPKSNNGGPHEKPTTTTQEPRACRSATNQRRHAHAEAPAGTRLAGTPLLFKVRALKASTKNPGLTPLTSPHRHSNLKVEPQTKTTATWRAQSEHKTGCSPLCCKPTQ